MRISSVIETDPSTRINENGEFPSNGWDDIDRTTVEPQQLRKRSSIRAGFEPLIYADDDLEWIETEINRLAMALGTTVKDTALGIFTQAVAKVKRQRLNANFPNERNRFETGESLALTGSDEFGATLHHIMTGTNSKPVRISTAIEIIRDCNFIRRNIVKDYETPETRGSKCVTTKEVSPNVLDTSSILSGIRKYLEGEPIFEGMSEAEKAVFASLSPEIKVTILANAIELTMNSSA